MNHFLKTIVLSLIISLGSGALWATTEKNYFQFVIPKYETKRQSGQVVTIYVRYAYKKNLPESQYFDYRIMRSEVLRYMEPSKALPEEVYWELIATKMGRELMKHYPIEGISVQLDVLDNQNSGIYEPGDHGPTFTIGDIAPLDVHH